MAARGQPDPEWLANQPELLPGEDFYMRAFWDLSTERQVGFTLGPIPGSLIDEYGSRNGLDFDTMDLFRAVIRMLDDAYIKWAAEQQARARKSQE